MFLYRNNSVTPKQNYRNDQNVKNKQFMGNLIDKNKNNFCSCCYVFQVLNFISILIDLLLFIHI